MTCWHFRLRNHATEWIDASSIRRPDLAQQERSHIERIRLVVDGIETALAEAFDLAITASHSDRIVVQGDLRRVDGLATCHDEGDFEIEGHVGRHLGCGASGGTITVRGNAGDFVGGPRPGKKIGLAGSSVHVRGSVGDYAGHRMRRGVLMVDGDLGRHTAASMIAGTIVAGAGVGANACVGMRRGTLLMTSRAALNVCLNPPTPLAARRFSNPVAFRANFLGLCHEGGLSEMIDRMFGRQPFDLRRVRADRSIGGLGELIF